MYVTEAISRREYHFVLQTVAYRVTVGDFCLENSTIYNTFIFVLDQSRLF
jgi:hypothetical protein